MREYIIVRKSWIHRATKIANDEGRNGRRATVQILPPETASGDVSYVINIDSRERTAADPD